MTCDEEKVRPGNQRSLLKIEMKKNLLPLAGVTAPWENTPGFCALKHPPKMTAAQLGDSWGQSCPSTNNSGFCKATSQSYFFTAQVPDAHDPVVQNQHHLAMNTRKHLEKYPVLSHVPCCYICTFRIPVSVKYFGILKETRSFLTEDAEYVITC